MYTEAIADAAREYLAAVEADKIQKRESTKVDAAKALVLLDWMIKAERYNWDISIHGGNRP